MQLDHCRSGAWLDIDALEDQANDSSFIAVGSTTSIKIH